MEKKFLIILILITGKMLFAQNPNLGTSGAQFLQIPVGARAESMGGALVGLTGDAEAMFWNPAGISKVKNVDAHFSYMNWFDLFDFNAAALVYNIENVGTFGASIIVLSTEKMEITTEEEPNGTGRYFDGNDVALSLTYAKYLTDRFSVGLTVKYISQRIWNESADAIAFDVGTQYLLDFQNLTIANNYKINKRNHQKLYWFEETFQNKLLNFYLENKEIADYKEELEMKILADTVTPFLAVDKLLQKIIDKYQK